MARKRKLVAHPFSSWWRSRQQNLHCCDWMKLVLLLQWQQLEQNRDEEKTRKEEDERKRWLSTERNKQQQGRPEEETKLVIARSSAPLLQMTSGVDSKSSSSDRLKLGHRKPWQQHTDSRKGSQLAWTAAKEEVTASSYSSRKVIFLLSNLTILSDSAWIVTGSYGDRLQGKKRGKEGEEVTVLWWPELLVVKDGDDVKRWWWSRSLKRRNKNAIWGRRRESFLCRGKNVFVKDIVFNFYNNNNNNNPKILIHTYQNINTYIYIS